MADTAKLSIIIPTLDEAATIEALLAQLSPWNAQGVELLVVDGGSLDETVSRASPLA